MVREMVQNVHKNVCSLLAKKACDFGKYLCRNGGTCVNGYQKEYYTCTCPKGFSGDHCEMGESATEQEKVLRATTQRRLLTTSHEIREDFSAPSTSVQCTFAPNGLNITGDDIDKFLLYTKDSEGTKLPGARYLE